MARHLETRRAATSIRGDPAVTGAAAIDSVRSLNFAQVQAFDAVKNRMTVRESELVPGATWRSGAGGGAGRAGGGARQQHHQSRRDVSGTGAER